MKESMIVTLVLAVPRTLAAVVGRALCLQGLHKWSQWGEDGVRWCKRRHCYHSQQIRKGGYTVDRNPKFK